jgi:glutathione peroxidase
MKYVLSLIVLSLLLSFRQAGGIYNITLKNIDGKKIDLNEYKGKKMLFMVLPLSSNDTTMTISQLSQLQAKYQSTVVVIGIPAEETGFKATDTNKFKMLYKDAGANFILAEGMKVKKGGVQSSLFQWLTNKNMNHHFDQDVEGVGSKFFVDETGELYAAMGPRLKLSNPVIDRILTRVPGKKQ